VARLAQRAALVVPRAAKRRGGTFEVNEVVFLAFPLEAYGDAAAKSGLVTRVMNFFNS